MSEYLLFFIHTSFKLKLNMTDEGLYFVISPSIYCSFYSGVILPKRDSSLSKSLSRSSSESESLPSTLSSPVVDFAPDPEALASDPSSGAGMLTGIPKGILKVPWSDYLNTGTFEAVIDSLINTADIKPIFNMPSKFL